MMIKPFFISFLLGGVFILPLAFLDQLWSVAAYFLVSGMTTLVAGRLRRHNQVNLKVGIGASFVGLMLYAIAPNLELVSGMTIAIGCGAATFALLEQLACIGTLAPLLTQQLFVSAGNAITPIAISFGMSARLIAIAGAAVCVVAGLWCHFQGSLLHDLGERVGSTSLWMTVASGLATTIQFSYIYAAQQIVDGPEAIAAVWVGASVGTVIGRLAGVVFVRYLNWRVVAALVLITAASTPLFTLANDIVHAFIISLVGVIAMAPALPLLLANSFLPSHSASRAVDLFEPGSLSLAISTATGGVLPVVLALTRFQIGWVMAVAAMGLAAILLGLGRTHHRLNIHPTFDSEEIR